MNLCLWFHLLTKVFVNSNEDKFVALLHYYCLFDHGSSRNLLVMMKSFRFLVVIPPENVTYWKDSTWMNPNLMPAVLQCLMAIVHRAFETALSWLVILFLMNSFILCVFIFMCGMLGESCNGCRRLKYARQEMLLRSESQLWLSMLVFS